VAWPALAKSSPWLPFAEAIAKAGGFLLDMPFEKLTAAQQRIILHGTGDVWLDLDTKRKAAMPRFQYKGLYPAVDEASRISFVYRARLEHLVDEIPCPACRGSRLRSDAAATRFAQRTLGELCSGPLGETYTHIDTLKLSKRERQIAGEVL